MTRFFRRTITKFYFVETIADQSGPTIAELATALALHQDVGEVSGFTFSNSPIDTPDFESAFVKSIPGEDTAEDSSMTFYEDDTTNPIRDALTKGTVGYIVIFSTGISGASPQIGDNCEVWPVSIASSARQYSAGNDAAMYQVTYTITDVPEPDAVVAA